VNIVRPDQPKLPQKRETGVGNIHVALKFAATPYPYTDMPPSPS